MNNFVIHLFYICIISSCFSLKVHGFNALNIDYKSFLVPIIIAIGGITISINSLLTLYSKKQNFNINNFQIKNAFCNAITIVAFFESLYVVICFAIYKEYPIAGTFDNPAGAALCMVLSLPFYPTIATSKTHLKKGGLILIKCTTITAILLTESRTGYICLALYLLLISSSKIRYSNRMLLLFLFICSLFILSTIKTGSNTGRFFILSRSWDIIREKPFIGHGHNSFYKLYMQKQSEYFMYNPNSPYAWFADDIRHPLNEFILLWIEHGLLIVCLANYIFIKLIRRLFKAQDNFHHQIAFSVLSLFIFCFFSYPSRYPLSWVILIMGFLYSTSKKHKNFVSKNKTTISIITLTSCIYLLYSFSNKAYYEIKWKKIARKALHNHSKKTMNAYKELYNNHFSSNPYFIYNYAAELFYAGNFKEALFYANKCSTFWTSYNLSLLTGDICRMAQKYNKSITYYRNAHHMCPIRFAPLEGLYYSYKSIGNYEQADSIATIIAVKEIKIPSYDVFRIKKEIEIDWRTNH